MKHLFPSTAAAAVMALSAFTQPALAQATTGGTSSNVGGQDVSVGTSGSGQVTRTPDGTSLGVTGGAEATAADGGTATTDSRARLTERRAMQSSKARASDEDERARSRTRTMVREDGTVRSRSHSVYKADGERPVVDRSYSVTQPDGTTTTR